MAARRRSSPGSGAARASRGSLTISAYDDHSDFDRAVSDCNEAIRLDPKYAVAFNNRGVAYRGKCDPDRAIADFNEAIRLDLKYANAFSNRGNAYRGKGDLERAVSDYSEGIRLDPEKTGEFTGGTVVDPLAGRRCRGDRS